MDVSVIIVNYNTFELTCNCVRSIKQHTVSCKYEIIIVDNDSTEKPAEEFKSRFPDIILVKNSTNEGFAKGNNEGIRKASGTYILLLNSDAELKNNAILICLRFLEAHSGVAVVSSKLEYPDGRPQHNCQRFPSIRYLLFELLRLQKFLPRKWGGKILLGFFFDHNSVVYPDWIWGTFFLFKRELLQELPTQKLADEFFMYVEDMQWCMEFRKLGYTIAFEPKAITVHHMGQSKGKKNYLIEKNMAIFMEHYYSPWKRKLIRFLSSLLSGGTQPGM
jgi:GT2 family glycosyltransferase